MRQINIIALFALIPFIMLGQEYETTLKCHITKATVYFQGAQLTMSGSSSLKKGETTFIVKGLSANIDKNSIQIGGNGLFSILQVNYTVNYFDTIEQSQKQSAINAQIKEISEKIKDDETTIGILSQKKDFLVDNRKIVGEKQSASPELYKSVKDIFYQDIQQVLTQLDTHNRTLELQKERKRKYEDQLRQINGKASSPTGEISISVDSKLDQDARLDITFFLNGASWTPIYDIRVDEVGKPITLICRANVSQQTGMDWKNIKLSLSNANPNQTGTIPSMNPVFVSFYEPTYSPQVSEDVMKGKAAGAQVKSNSGSPGGSSMVSIRGVATMNNTEPLYVINGTPVNGTPTVNPSDIKSISVIKEASACAVYGSRGANGVVVITTKNPSSNVSFMPNKDFGNQPTVFEYKIETPYSIANDGTVNAIELQTITLDATYEYQCVPKKEKNAFLIAKTTDWEKYNIIPGEANLFFENMFVGKTMIDISKINDTLELSLGRDKSIVVDRQKTSEFSNKSFIGFNKVLTRSWEIGIKNNKPKDIVITVFDQMPISSNNQITVENKELSDGNLNTESGLVTWRFNLKSQELKKLKFSYTIKFPKDKQINVE